MKRTRKKRGQRIIKKVSRASIKVSEEGKEHVKENLIKRFSHIANIKLLILEWSMLVLAIIMLAVTQAFWFSDSYSENVFVSGGTYIEATLGDVDSMNPLFASTSSEKVLSKLMFATISTIDRSGHVGIGLAKSIMPSEDGKVWTVTVRDDLKWSDGEPVTSEDVLFTVNLIKNPAVASTYNANLANVKVSLDDDGKVVFTLPSSYADFDSALNIPVVPKHILENTDPKTLVEDSFSTTPITSGAFTFNAIQSGASAKEKVYYLSNNPEYYKGNPMLNSFAIHTYEDKESIIKALNDGSVTATAELSAIDRNSVSSGQLIEKASSLNSGAFVFFNTASEVLKNKDLRIAIREGINVGAIRNEAPDTKALDYPLLSSQIALSNYPSLPAYNFESAKAKVSEILNGESPNVNIATVNSGFLPNVTHTLADELKKLGFNTNVIVYDENQDFITNVISKRMYDILVYEIELGADPDLLPYYHSSQASSSGLNLSNYRDALVDDLLLGARDTLDEDLRKKKYEAFLEYWVNNVPAIALYQPNLVYYYNKNARTFNNDVKLVTPIDRFSDITDWATVKETRNKTP